MSDPTPPPREARVCPSCGTENWPSARFCAECGARLVAEEELARDFESTVADVVDAPDSVPAAVIAEEPPPTVNQRPTEWPSAIAQPAGSKRNTALWVVLGIFAFILACCCGLSLLVAISSANDSALHRELSFLL